MPRSFSSDLRWRIVYLYQDGYSKQQIAKVLYISKAMVEKVLRIYNKWNYVIDLFSGTRGWQKLFNNNDMKVNL